MVVRVLKYNYFSTISASSNSYPVALFQVTQNLLGGNNSGVHLQSHCEKCVEHLENTIAQIHSELDCSLGAGPVETTGPVETIGLYSYSGGVQFH